MESINKLLILIRGVSGSGKSTLANMIRASTSPTPKIHEADQYFIDPRGSYNFQQELIWEAHRWCYNNVKQSMYFKEPLIIVSNTSTRRWEYEQYVVLARQYGYMIQVIDVHGEFQNIHNLPEEALKRMEERWTPFDRQLLDRGRRS